MLNKFAGKHIALFDTVRFFSCKEKFHPDESSELLWSPKLLHYLYLPEAIPTYCQTPWSAQRRYRDRVALGTFPGVSRPRRSCTHWPLVRMFISGCWNARCLRRRSVEDFAYSGKMTFHVGIAGLTLTLSLVDVDYTDIFTLPWTGRVRSSVTTCDAGLCSDKAVFVWHQGLTLMKVGVP